MTSSAPIDSPATCSRHRWLWLLAWLLLSVYFVTPPREAFDQSLDKSNYATYPYFLAHSFQWGVDVLPMTGPFGFILYGHTYAQDLYGMRIVGDLLLKAVFSAVLLLLFSHARKGILRWLWLAVVILLVPTVDDLLHDFAILIATLVLLARRDRTRDAFSGLAVLLLGALALFKGTHLLTAALCFSSVLALCAFERRWKAAATLAIAYAASFLGFWLLAGQNPLNLPTYIKAVLELSSGYNATMGLDESPFVRDRGLALAGGLALIFAWDSLSIRRSMPRMIAAILLVGFSFIKWKHGFLRADGHVGIFFTSVPVILLTYCLVRFTPLVAPAARGARIWNRLVTGALVVATCGAAYACSINFEWFRPRLAVAEVPARIAGNLRFLARYDIIRADLDREIARRREDVPIPQINNEVGQDSVDFFGYEEGVLLMNGLNYRPRPMGGGSFNVFTPWLQERNEAFVRDPRRAPTWQVMKLQTLDGRFPATDDPLTLRAILECYNPVLIQRDFLLLKRRAAPPPPVAPVLLETRRVRPGEHVVPPDPGQGRMLLFTLDAPLSLAGRLRGFLYRPPALSAKVASRDHPEGIDFALKPALLQRPAIISPLLIDNRDVLWLFSNNPGDPVRSIKLSAAAGFALDRLSISFFAAPRPPTPEESDIDEIIAWRKYPLYNRTPTQFVTAEVGVRELNKEPVSFVHAPGAMVWNLEPDDQQVLFSFGLMPNGYLNGGNTDGVEFSVEVVSPNGEGSVLFKQLLRPCTEIADRGMHRARVFLPTCEKGSQLRIRTGPGPSLNGAYDQAFITRVQIKKGPTKADKVVRLGPAGPDPATSGVRPPLNPEQYNGLGVIPADGNLPKQAIASVAGRPVFLVHALGEIVLVVPPEAHEFTCEIGLLPGAYEKGNSDGVNYTFSFFGQEWTRNILAQRFIDPFHRPEDRGPQTIHLALPPEAAGMPMAIVTDPGVHGDASWDHSYIANVQFH